MLAVGAVVCVGGSYIPNYFLSPSLWEIASCGHLHVVHVRGCCSIERKKGLKYCLKEPLNPKQPQDILQDIYL